MGGIAKLKEGGVTGWELVFEPSSFGGFQLVITTKTALIVIDCYIEIRDATRQSRGISAAARRFAN
jgi:hypothetical protein